MSAVFPQPSHPMTRLLWFRDPHGVTPFINETAVRIRAGIMLVIPVFMAFTLVDIVFGTRWIVTGNLIRDTFDTDFDGRILYMVEAVRRTYDYTVQTGVLFYALFEMLAGEKPFTDNNPMAIIYKHRHQPVPRLPPGVAQWQYLVDSLLAKLPAERFASAAVAEAALDQAAAQARSVAA